MHRRRFAPRRTTPLRDPQPGPAPVAPANETSDGLAFRRALHALAEDVHRERIFLSDVLDALGERALTTLMLVFALPNALPAPPGTSAVLGLPLLCLSAQLTTGRPPWLPAIVVGSYEGYEAMERILPVDGSIATTAPLAPCFFSPS